VTELAKEWEDFVKYTISGGADALEDDEEAGNRCCDIDFGFRRCKARLTPEQLSRYKMVRALVRRMMRYSRNPCDAELQNFQNLSLFNVTVGGNSDEEHGEAPYNATLLLAAVNKNPDIWIFIRCEGDRDLQVGCILDREQLLVPSSVLMSIVDQPGDVALQWVDYRWLPEAKLEVLGITDITQSIWTDPLIAKKKKKKQAKDEVMEILKPTLPSGRPKPSKKTYPKKKGKKKTKSTKSRPHGA